METSVVVPGYPKSIKEELNNDETKADLKENSKDESSNELKKHPFQCEICDKILTTKHSLKLHKEIHLDPEQRETFRCEICEATFKTQPGLNYHLETKHNPDFVRKKLPCPRCGRIFKSVEGRKIHMTIQHGAGGPIFKCKECPMVFARKPHLDLHMTTHGSGLLVCTICGKPYARLKDLSRHEAYCGVKELCCPVCGKQFRKEQALENHRKKCRSNSWKPEPRIGEKRGRQRKSDSGGEEAKVRLRRSKYDQYIGLEHLAVPSALIDEVKPVKFEGEPAESTPRRFPCEHCPLKFVTMKALQNHGQRRHWEVLGLTEPALEKRGRKRTRPLERVPKKVGRPRKIVNYVDPEDLPDEVECDVVKEEVDPVKSEDAFDGEPGIVFVPEAIQHNIDVEEKRELIDEFEDPVLGNRVAKEEKREAEIKFGDYEFNHFENDSTDGDDSVKEHMLEDIVKELDTLQEATSDEVEQALKCNASDEPQVSRELVIRLEKLDYPTLVESNSNKNPSFQSIGSESRTGCHESAQGPSLSTSYRCEGYNISYQVEYKLKIHNEKVHGIAKKRPTSTLTCKHCGQKMSSWLSLVRHTKSFHGETIDETKFVQCPSCRTRFLSEEERDEHACLKTLDRVREQKQRSFNCRMCHKAYSSLLYLECHYPVHPEYRNFTCELCSKFFFKESALDSHKSRMHVPETASLVKKIRPFKSKYKNPFPRSECEHCGQTFAYRYRLALHRVNVHGSTETPMTNRQAPKTTLPRNFHCDQCDKSYHFETNLATHKAKIHGVGVAPPKETKPSKHTCKHCKKQFTDWSTLVYHRKFIHGEIIDKAQSVQCPSCLLKFISDEELAEHLCLKGVIRRTERPFECDLCDKTYPTKSQLEGHYSVHLEYHNFKCDQCAKGFFNENGLNKHKNHMHKAKEAYLQCGTCNQMFKNQQNLKRHQELHSDRVYCCEHCGRKFKTGNILYSHLKHVHRDDQAIPCTICGKTMNGKKSLKAHMLVHNNDRQFKCSFPSCGKAFLTGHCLKVHMQSHTKDYRFKCKFCEYGTVVRKRIQLHEQREHNHNRFAVESDP